MADTIVKVPKDADKIDYDFIAFSFGGKHSYDDFGIYRISDGKDGYNENIAPTMQDKVVDVPDGDGQYFFGTLHKTKTFNINFAFDSLTEEKLRELRDWLNGKEVKDLWFDETPYKVYSAKVTGSPTIKANVFGDTNSRLYKGTGSVTFTCYYPYGRTPNVVLQDNVRLNGQQADSYKGFLNRGAFLTTTKDENGTPTYSMPTGQLPAPFVAKLSRLGYYTVTLQPNNSGYTPIELVVPHGGKIAFETDGEINVYGTTDNLIDTKTEFAAPNDLVRLEGWHTSKEEADGAPTYKLYDSNTSGKRKKLEIEITSNQTLYAYWSEYCTVTFYKTLDSGAKQHYISFFDSWEEHTGRQELYGVSVDTGEGMFSVLDTTAYRGKFSDDGTISSIKLPIGTKLYLWVQHNPEYRSTTCHINIDSGFSAKDTFIAKINPATTITLNKDAHIVFDENIDIELRKPVWWSPIPLPCVATDNWNCFVYGSTPNITKGELITS